MLIAVLMQLQRPRVFPKHLAANLEPKHHLGLIIFAAASDVYKRQLLYLRVNMMFIAAKLELEHHSVLRSPVLQVLSSLFVAKLRDCP